MAFRATVALGCTALASFARASQPGAAEPVAAPMRELQWGQLNFLHTTDTHGWHGGHLQESQYSADWGDYISFAEHLRKRADKEGRDLLLIDTGDRVEGNGLYDASSPKGKYTYDIFREQDIDLICTGNHELYQADTTDREHNVTVPNFKKQYIASNVDYIDPATGERIPMAHRRFRRFKTKNQKIDVLAFGFLFDFTGNANNSAVRPVEETIKEAWFQEAIRERPDIFVVIGHVGVRMQEFREIFTAIRKQNWFAPIAFFGGHAHVRDAVKYDARAFALASGRYFETIGWMSVDGLYKDSEKTQVPVTFQRRYIDNNVLGLRHHAGLPANDNNNNDHDDDDDNHNKKAKSKGNNKNNKNNKSFLTERGKKVSAAIATARTELALDEHYGCAPRDLWMGRVPYPSNDSIYTWLETEVLPSVVTRKDHRRETPRLAILNTGGIRFDIFEGAFTRDATYIVSPFTSGLDFVADVPYGVARKVLALLNSGGPIFDASEAGTRRDFDVRFLAPPEQWFGPAEDVIVKPQPSGGRSSKLVPGQDDAGQGQKPMAALLGSGGGGGEKTKPPPGLVDGYTTKDDISADGDDAEHSPLSFYRVPNCVQAQIGFPSSSGGGGSNGTTATLEDAPPEPEKVDVVFISFIQPWVLLALRFAGGEYTEKDVAVYREGTFTEMVAEWVKENWKGEC